MSSWFTRPFLALLSLTFIFAIAVPAYAEESSIQSSIQGRILELEDDFKTLSQAFFESELAATKTVETLTNIDHLARQVAKLNQSGDTAGAILLLYHNQPTLNNNIDNKQVFEFIDLLLSNNEWHLASVLYEAIEYEGDKSLLATVKFLFAKYHAQRHEWKQVHGLLRGITTELASENADYANLLNGSALQYLRQHRQAIDSYKKIPATSRYYSYAKLNSAIANIRQGWWTDAQIAITDYLASSGKDNRDEMVNRLNLVLGYALLQREYYRDARNAFRQVGLESRYTNRALLGIGLTATSQGDFVGGLNALSILKDKKTFDLSVDESYLLVPYVYEKLQQELTVSASYTEAMNYYQQRIDKLKQMLKSPIDFSSVTYDVSTSILISQQTSLDYGKHYPRSFLNNYRLLQKYASLAKNKTLKKNIDKSLQTHALVFQQIMKHLLELRLEYLKSYLNQSRYGLARLYDSSNEATQ